MRLKPITHILLPMAILLSGCVPTATTQETITSTLEEATLTVTPTATLTLTATPQPSPTAIPPTSTFVQSPTQTPLPTLEPEQAEETIRTLLREPVDCSAPCFWGIVPGQTTLYEATHIFTYMGLPVQFTNERDNKKFYEFIYDFESGLSISPLLTVQDGLVKNLRIYLTPEISQPGVPREWLAFSPETLIARYGEPSKVELDLIPGPRTSDFVMIMYFDAFDLIVQYGGYGIIQGTRICPLKDPYDEVRIWMGKDPENPPGPLRRLEEVTSLTLAEFSALMTGEPAKACFNLREEALMP